MTKLLSRRSFVAASAATLIGTKVTPVSAQTAISYYSDYFSFVGRDNKGLVAFAIDNNRGRYGDTYQADHFIEYFDETDGYRRIKGDGRYQNTSRQVEQIPPSFNWRSSGTPAQGISLMSVTNALKLITRPLTPIYRNEDSTGEFWVSAAGATLITGARIIYGRVIYEFIRFNDQNRFVGIRKGRWDNFNGLYMLVDKDSDLYFHHREGMGNPLSEPRAGFATWKGPAKISDLEPEVTSSEKAENGEFHWPTAWTGTFKYSDKHYRYIFHARNRDVVHNWKNGGFAMSTADGTITSIDGKESHNAIGFAELLI